MKCAWKELLSILPLWLRPETDKLGREALQEIRLRLTAAPEFLIGGRKVKIPGRVLSDDLSYILNAACRYSPWTAGSMASGYLTAPGGHRIGICGEAVMKEGIMTGYRTIRSVNIRVARDFPGISRNILPCQGSILIIGSPGCGKTTLLRDLIRLRSASENISVVDERGELFPPGADFEMDGGTDVLTGCPKAQGIEAVLRSMGPDVIAVDEITSAVDCAALLEAGRCGVKVLATAHANGKQDLYHRPIYRQLVNNQLFDKLVILSRDKSYRLERMDI